MASILNEDFINQDDWAVELAIGCKMFATDPKTRPPTLLEETRLHRNCSTDKM